MITDDAFLTKQKIDTELAQLTPPTSNLTPPSFNWAALSSVRMQHEAPNFFNLVQQAVATAEIASELDKPYVMPQMFYLTENPEISLRGAYDTTHQQQVMFVSKPYVSQLNMKDLLAFTTHEIIHQQHPIEKGTISQSKLLELEADRGADTMQMIEARLSLLVDLPKIRYREDDPKDEHVSLRDDLITLLHEAYGDHIFKSNGQFEYQSSEVGVHRYQFVPKKADGLPATERGEKVYNWEAIHRDIDQAVLADIQQVDKLIEKGFARKNQQEFMQHLQQNVAKFASDPAHQASFTPPKADSSLER